MMNGGAISWESKRQKVTALSSAESEFYAASAVGCELVFLRRIADAMGFVQVGPTLVAEDNVACIYMSKSSSMYHKAKAIDTRVYRLREFVADGVMELYYVATADQAADCFTKSLPSEAVRRHRTKASSLAPTAAGAVLSTNRCHEDGSFCAVIMSHTLGCSQ
eukprot:114884-Rhodomonas_salina.2